MIKRLFSDIVLPSSTAKFCFHGGRENFTETGNLPRGSSLLSSHSNTLAGRECWKQQTGEGRSQCKVAENDI